ncbi:MAG: transcriptional repressor [Deltaproteobacteria bacterium]|nr:transcriptional repressor [Deltaproteobacteria bacterium]
MNQRGTVCRNLEILSQIGRIQTYGLAGTDKRFDGRTDTHDQVRCARCGRGDDVPVALIPVSDEALMGITDYEAFSHRLEFVGLCAWSKRDGDEAR